MNFCKIECPIYIGGQRDRLTGPSLDFVVGPPFQTERYRQMRETAKNKVQTVSGPNTSLQSFENFTRKHRGIRQAIQKRRGCNQINQKWHSTHFLVKNFHPSIDNSLQISRLRVCYAVRIVKRQLNNNYLLDYVEGKRSFNRNGEPIKRFWQLFPLRILTEYGQRVDNALRTRCLLPRTKSGCHLETNCLLNCFYHLPGLRNWRRSL